jgi:hypothetical protein
MLFLLKNWKPKWTGAEKALCPLSTINGYYVVRYLIIYLLIYFKIFIIYLFSLFKCSDCWAYVATSAIEAIIKIETWTLEKLSGQEFIDCDRSCKGCGGGWPENAFDYMRKEWISLEKDYKQSYEGPCRVKRSNVKTFIVGLRVFMWRMAAQNNGWSLPFLASQWWLL